MKFYHKERRLYLQKQIQVFIQVQELLYILIKSLKSCRIISTDMSKSMENGQEIVFLDIAIAVESIQNLFA